MNIIVNMIQFAHKDQILANCVKTKSVMNKICCLHNNKTAISVYQIMNPIITKQQKKRKYN